MAKSRTITTNLSRVFDSTDALVYIVKAATHPIPDKETDSFPKIVYANEACLDWVELEFSTLKEANCIYSSLPLENQIDNKLRGLTPPFADATESVPWQKGFFVFVENTKGEKRWRSAQAKAIGTGQGGKQFEYWLVIADTPDLQESPSQTGAFDSSFDPKLLHAEIAALNRQQAIIHSLNNLVGCSPFSFGLRRAATAAISSPHVDLMITGPPGSGREHLARVLFHERNKNNPHAKLVPLHCAIADQKMVQENIKELAADAKTESNDNCLLLLDIDRLPPAAQIELSGFLQLPNFHLQTIATASARLTAIDSFDSLLAQMLNTFVIELIPLCERMEDIPLLAQAFLEQTNASSPHQVVEFSPAALQMLLNYNWPGNLDQLLQSVQFAVAQTAGRQILPEDFPPELRHGIKAQQVTENPIKSIDLTVYLEKIEAELVERALTRCNGNKSKSAKLLGISRPRLLRRLKQLGLDGWLKTDQPNDQIDSSAFEETNE